MDDKSRMSREAHVRFCESVTVKSRRATRPCAESFFGSLKRELIDDMIFPTRREAKTAIFEYIEAFYNRQRLHSTNGYSSPVDFEEESAIESA